MSTLRIEDAMKLVLRFYSENGYSKDRVLNAKNVLLQLDEVLSLGTFSHDMEGIEAFIRHQELPYYAACDLRHFSSMVFCAMATGAIASPCIRAPKAPCIQSCEYISELECYVSLLRKQGKARSTVRFEVWANRELLAYLESIGITRFADISTIHLLNYQKLRIPSYAQSTGKAMILRIRHFIKYLILENKVSPTLLPCMQSKVMQKESVTTILTEEQRLTLMNLPKPTTVKEARDNAVILCALRLGLRKSDIYKLKLTEIDWEKKRISLVQKKTHQPLVLPLPQDVGNAIADYILNFRPDCPSAFVFISLRAPYSAITGADVIEQKLGNHPTSNGYHILRRTCATSLLNNGIGAQTIMNVLGQQDMSSLDCYLSLDKSKMEQNSLGLAAVGLPEVLS
jgi:site-specific recombinase XerD